MPRLTHPFLALSAPLLNGLGIGAGLLLCTGVIAPLWGLPAAIAASSGYGAVGVTDTVTTSMLTLPRPNTSTTSGVKATSGMDWVTSETGNRVCPSQGQSVPATARMNATANPASMPSRAAAGRAAGA